MRPRATAICAQPGCPNRAPCPQHTPQPWANAKERRAGELTGRALQQRNRRIMARHRGVCHWCGRTGANQIDHVIPRAEGGTDTDDNLRPIHQRPCHAEKTQHESQRGRHPATHPLPP